MKTTFTFIPTSLLRAGVFAALLVLLNVGQAFATTYVFTGTGNWDNSARWSPSYPGTNIPTGHAISIQGVCFQNVDVTTSSSITINSGKTLHIGNLTMNANLINNGTVNVNVTLTINSGKTFTHKGTSASISGVLHNSGTVNVNAAKTLTINSGGTFTHNGTSASISGALVNSGTVTVNAAKTLTINSGGTFLPKSTSSFISGTLNNNGTVYIDAGYTLTINSSGTFTHNGTNNGSQCTIYGTLNNIGTITVNAGRSMIINPGGTFTHDGTASFSGLLHNAGTFNLNAGKTLTINPGGTFIHDGDPCIISGILHNAGTFNLNAGKTLTINSGGTLTHDGTWASIYGTLTNNGTGTVNAGKTLTIRPGGTFTNNNTFNHNGILNGKDGTIGGTASFSNPSGSTVAPGLSPGCLTFSNGLTNDGNLEIEVNGTTACSQFDRITVTGTATLGGTLNVSIGYTPTNGDVITFLDATSISGTFSSVSAPSGWSLAYDSPNAGEVSLQYALLPVELVSFQAERQNDHASLLTWRTASEQNNEGFDIQRSNNGGTWQNLAFMPGHGTTQAQQSYAFVDERPLSGTNYYRLRQVDFDGKMEYSDIRSVVMGSSTNGGVAIYPNPMKNGLLNVNFAAEQEGTATLRIFDASGKLLHREVLANQQNQTNYGHLSAGIYFIEINNGKNVWQERLVVQ